MVLWVTIGAGALCGASHRLGKLGMIPSYGYDSERPWPAAFKVLAWAMVLAAVGLIGGFDGFGDGLLFGLAFVGAWKIAEEVAEMVLGAARR